MSVEPPGPFGHEWAELGTDYWVCRYCSCRKGGDAAVYDCSVRLIGEVLRLRQGWDNFANRPADKGTGKPVIRST